MRQRCHLIPFWLCCRPAAWVSADFEAAVRAAKADQTACKPGSVPPAEADAAAIPLGRTLLCGSRDLPGRLGPATALPWRAKARRPYLVLLQAGLAMPSLSPGTRCALTAPFHPYLPTPRRGSAGGLLSVALSLGSRPAGVTRRLVAVEPGLSSSLLRRGFAGPRPPGRLIRLEHGLEGPGGQLREKAWRRQEPWPYPDVGNLGRRGGPARGNP